jgi:hypothetical protein
MSGRALPRDGDAAQAGAPNGESPDDPISGLLSSLSGRDFGDDGARAWNGPDIGFGQSIPLDGDRKDPCDGLFAIGRMEAEAIAAIEAGNYDFCPKGYGQPGRSSTPPDGAQFYPNFGNPADCAVKQRRPRSQGN